MPLFGRIIKAKRRHERREDRRDVNEKAPPEDKVSGPLGILPRPLPRLQKNLNMIHDKYMDTEKHKDPERSAYQKVKRKLDDYRLRFGDGKKKKELRCKPGELRCGRRGRAALEGTTRTDVDAVPQGTIKDINDRDDLQLVTDSQEVEHIKQHFGNPPALDDFDGFFVTIQDGDYGEVFAFEGSVPNLNKTLWKVEWPASGKALGDGSLAAIYTKDMTAEQIKAQIEKLIEMSQMTEDEGKIATYNDMIRSMQIDIEQMKGERKPDKWGKGGMLAGKHKDVPRSQFDPEQLEKGIKIEMEHTNDPKEAEEIAVDHLAEIPDYYTRLEKMEAEAKSHEECSLCKVACETLGDEQYCKIKFDQMTNGEITREELDKALDRKYGEDWIDKVMNKLGG